MTRGKQVTIGSIVASLIAIGTIATTLDVPVPKPAWEADVRAIEAQVRDVDRLATEEALQATQLRLYRNLAEQDKYRQQDQPVPDLLLKEQAALELKKQRLERRLRRLE